jgi:hypothetical protein
MANVVYKSLSSLSPIVLQYNYYSNEKLVTTANTFKNGYNVTSLQGLANYQDVAINKSSCFVLTSTVNLSAIFAPLNPLNIGSLPAAVMLQPRFSNTQFVTYNTNTFELNLSSGSSIFCISPIPGTSQVELFVNNKYLQIANSYPYNAILSNVTLPTRDINRQRFNVVYQNNTISFYTLTDSGYRYLSFNNFDYTLRATGILLNNSVYNDYVFTCIPITSITQQQGFTPTNDWITYYFDVETKTENKTVTVNKDYDTLTNLLIDFATDSAISSGIANVNIANLKTNLTPTGGPAPLDNTYDKTSI